MKELSKRQQKFYRQWEERRKKKWLYVFLHGTVYWGLFMAIIMFLWNNDFDIEKMKISKFITAIIVFGIAGIFVGLNQFRQIEKIYLKLNDDSEIMIGIQKLKSEEIWKYENLILRNENNKTLIVRNEIMWFDNSEISNEKLNYCVKVILNDFQNLNKNERFKEFAMNLETKIQVFDNSESEIPLIEKTLTTKDLLLTSKSFN